MASLDPNCWILFVFFPESVDSYLQVILGRSTDDVDVDIDLRKEGHANKISRRQVIFFHYFIHYKMVEILCFKFEPLAILMWMKREKVAWSFCVFNPIMTSESFFFVRIVRMNSFLCRTFDVLYHKYKRPMREMVFLGAEEIVYWFTSKWKHKWKSIKYLLILKIQLPYHHISSQFLMFIRILSNEFV